MHFEAEQGPMEMQEITAKTLILWQTAGGKRSISLEASLKN
jgi:hypothetical protein